jgi:hypothetical protein
LSELLARALRALGPGAKRDEIALVARALRDSGDEETLALFGLPQEGPELAFDRAALGRVEELAEAVGASPFVALDLYVYVTAGPDWTPFPWVAAAEDEE